MTKNNFLVKDLFTFILHVWAFSCIYICTPHMYTATEAWKLHWISSTGVAHSCEPPPECCELNSCLLAKQPVLITTLLILLPAIPTNFPLSRHLHVLSTEHNENISASQLCHMAAFIIFCRFAGILKYIKWNLSNQS